MKNAKKLIVKDLEIVYCKHNRSLTAVKGLSFASRENEFLCLLGPSGCGKTTALNAIGGFLSPKNGEILLNGEPITGPTRRIGIVFQNYALFPWKSVNDNIAAGLRMKGLSPYKIQKTVNYYLKVMQLANYSEFYPNELSGGMQQRVAVARTLANDPEIILMDEPFGSLDAQTRINLQEMLLRIWQEHKKTLIFVTHDIDEALLLGDRILVMTKRPGRIRKEIRNILPRPRFYELSTSNEYAKLKKEVIKSLE